MLDSPARPGAGGAPARAGAPGGGGGAGARPLLACFSHLRWDFVWQRPQHLLSRAARDWDVLVVEEPTWEDGATPRMAVSERPGGIRVATPVLPPWTLGEAETIEAQRRLVADLLAREPGRPRVFWYYTPIAMAFTDGLEADAVAFDKMDELSAFSGASPAMLENERALLARADVVFTGGMSLYEATRDRHGDVRAFPSSIDAAHFASARTPSGPEPADQAAIPRPRLGFFGVIDERMDLGLVEAAADLRPGWSFVMIGPVAKIDEASLPRRPNIHWLGPKTYAELPAYLAGWDVGFMPFALNESTRFISPTKTPEFLAAGVPVVSTRITDVARPYGEAGLVAIADTAAEAVAAAEAAMARPRGPWLAAVDRQLATGSWDRTWANMQSSLKDILLRDRSGTVT